MVSDGENVWPACAGPQDSRQLQWKAWFDPVGTKYPFLECTSLSSQCLGFKMSFSFVGKKKKKLKENNDRDRRQRKMVLCLKNWMLFWRPRFLLSISMWCQVKPHPVLVTCFLFFFLLLDLFASSLLLAALPPLRLCFHPSNSRLFFPCRCSFSSY